MGSDRKRDQERTPAGTDAGALPDHRRADRMLAKLQETDREPRILRMARWMRELLPGDSQLGDPLSTAGDEPSQLLARRVAETAAERPSVTRELGLGVLQVWQALSEAQGRGRGEEEMAILFTDLVEFSSWALEAGDEAALELLRKIGLAEEPAITARGGRVVKRLGDGLMAVFDHPQPAVEAAHAACREVDALRINGYQPRLRAGVHVGRPRRLGGDYLGVDVNVAARVASAASAGEVLISGPACERLDAHAFRLRRRRFRAKGAPKELEVYAAEPLPDRSAPSA
jgi:adenylate cyclase